MREAYKIQIPNSSQRNEPRIKSQKKHEIILKRMKNKTNRPSHSKISFCIVFEWKIYKVKRLTTHIAMATKIYFKNDVEDMNRSWNRDY